MSPIYHLPKDEADASEATDNSESRTAAVNAADDVTFKKPTGELTR